MSTVALHNQFLRFPLTINTLNPRSKQVSAHCFSSVFVYHASSSSCVFVLIDLQYILHYSCQKMHNAASSSRELFARKKRFTCRLLLTFPQMFLCIGPSQSGHSQPPYSKKERMSYNLFIFTSNH